jgi:uncharacterized protein YhdP
MPMQNWIDVREGDIRQVRKDSLELPACEKDLETWLDIEQEYIDHFGHGVKYEQVLRIRHKIALLRADLISDDKRMNKTLIAVEEHKLQQLERSMSEGMSIDQAKVHIDKFMGYRTNLKEITVLEWHNYIAEYGKQSDRKK